MKNSLLTSKPQTYFTIENNYYIQHSGQTPRELWQNFPQNIHQYHHTSWKQQLLLYCLYTISQFILVNAYLMEHVSGLILLVILIELAQKLRQSLVEQITSWWARTSTRTLHCHLSRYKLICTSYKKPQYLQRERHNFVTHTSLMRCPMAVLSPVMTAMTVW